MQQALQACLLALCLLVQSVAYGAQEVDSCGGYCPLYTMEQSLKRFRDSVDGLYAGQEDAVHSITKALMSNMIESANSMAAHTAGERLRHRTRPLLLHFTGPTGVGKTLMASLVQEALFITECGVKRVHLDIGFKYASAAAQRERIDAMKKSVVSQLEKCPRSLIIFDDFQWAPEKMILSLRDAFDPSIEALAFRDRRVATHQAVFVFCSDLEAEQRHLRADMTNEQARQKVSELAAAQWRMVDQASDFGQLFVQEGMVPFVPLSEPELRKVIHIEMSKLTPRLERYLSFTASNSAVEFKWLGRVRWNEKRLDPVILKLLGDDLTDYNARAIRNLIERHLLVHATALAQCLEEHSIRTEHKGWIWGSTVHLLDDVKVADVDHSHSFTVSVGDHLCLAPSMPLRRSTNSGSDTISVVFEPGSEL